MLCECTGCALYFEADLLADDEELACPLCGEPATEMSDERDSGAGLGALAVDRPLDREQPAAATSAAASASQSLLRGSRAAPA